MVHTFIQTFDVIRCKVLGAQRELNSRTVFNFEISAFCLAISLNNTVTQNLSSRHRDNGWFKKHRVKVLLLVGRQDAGVPASCSDLIDE
jgi:hypothetical protein